MNNKIKNLYYFYAFILGFGVGIIVAILFTPFSSSELRGYVKGISEKNYEKMEKKKNSLYNKWSRFSSNVDDLYRLYTHQDEIIRVNEVYSKEF